MVAGAPLKYTHEEVELIPSLENGDHLTRAEFERRFAAAPHIKKAELIEGVVHVPSPVSLLHADIHALAMAWLSAYWAKTPGLKLSDNATLILDFENEVQPDALVRIMPERGGKAQPSGKYLSGPPELVVEVALSSVAYDLHEKLRVYRRSGVIEYLVFVIDEKTTRWFHLEEGAYVTIEPDENGIRHSRVFPGLDLHDEYFWQNRLPELVAVVQRGLESATHAEFVARLADA
jgi:Uma2 family endonuclease